MKSDEELMKEVFRDINRAKRQIKKESKKVDKSKNFTDNSIYKDSFEETMQDIYREKKIIKKMTSEQVADWIIQEHLNHIKAMSYSPKKNFLIGQNDVDRSLIINYLYELTLFLELRDIKFLGDQVGQILKNRGENDLVLILKVLNYI